jgi:hypothetical protein
VAVKKTKSKPKGVKSNNLYPRDDVFATTQPLISNNPAAMDSVSLSPNVSQDLKGTKGAKPAKSTPNSEDYSFTGKGNININGDKPSKSSTRNSPTKKKSPPKKKK